VIIRRGTLNFITAAPHYGVGTDKPIHLNISMETNHSGYVSTPHYHTGGYLVLPAGQELNVSHVIYVPSGHVIMVSVWIYGYGEHQLPYLRLIVRNTQQGEETVNVMANMTWRAFETRSLGRIIAPPSHVLLRHKACCRRHENIVLYSV
jgi:hypothetical protein